MKKGIILLVLIAFTIGCGSKDGRVICNYQSENKDDNYKISSRYIIYYKENMVTTVKTEEVVTSTNKAVIEKFEDEYTKTYEKNVKKYDGYSYKIDSSSKRLTVNSTFDYSKIGVKELVKADSSLKEYVKGNKISKEGMKKFYEKIGATCN